MASAPTVFENIRFILGATGANTGLLLESEIDHGLALYPNNWRLAAAFIADALAARAVNDPSSFNLTGVLGVTWGERAKMWQLIAKSLRLEAAQMIDIAGESMGMTSILLAVEQELYEEPEYRSRGRYQRGLD